MKKLLLLLIFLFSLSHAFASPKQKICLNMIVKDEATVIERCLASVKPYIDYWVIVDTGSTDGTQQIIKEYMKDTPGELHERPWVNFEHNRNEALDLAKEKGDYLLYIDADENLESSPSFSLPLLTSDQYFIILHHGETTYPRTLLINTTLSWRWKGVLHEHILCPENHSQSLIQGIINQSHCDGHRRKDPLRYHKDLKVLQAAFKKEPTNSRYLFYIASCHMSIGNSREALDAYHKRSTMDGDPQEVFWSLFQIARLQEKLNMPPETFIASYHKAYQHRPSRIEPLAHLANYYRLKGNYMLGFLYAFYARSVHSTLHDTIFISPRIRHELVPLELSICAYYIGRLDIAKNISEQMLENPDLTPSIREYVLTNLEWINPKISSAKDQSAP